MRQHHAWIDRSLLNRLRERDILFFPYLCAIVGTYLTRVLRVREVTLGIPLTNRTNSPEKKPLVGISPICCRYALTSARSGHWRMWSPTYGPALCNALRVSDCRWAT